MFSELSQRETESICLEPQVDSARAEAWKLEDEVKVQLNKDQNNFFPSDFAEVYSLVGSFVLI